MTRQTTIETGAKLPSITKNVTQEKINAYAEVGGDGNPLHTDEAFAAKTQFEGTIAHGLLVLAYVSEMLTAAFGEAWLTSGKLKIRFRAPARPGDVVTTFGSVRSTDGGCIACEVGCLRADGEVLIDGRAEVPS